MHKWALVAGGVVGSTVLVVVATLIFEGFFSRVGVDEAWPAAISAVSTLVLVAVTAVYMVFTGVLVKLQSKSNSNMQRLENARAVRRALDLIYPTLRELRKVQRKHYPLKEEVAPDLEALRTLVKDDKLSNMSDDLRAISAQLPHELGIETLKASTVMLVAIRANTILARCVLNAEMDGLKRELHYKEEVVRTTRVSKMQVLTANDVSGNDEAPETRVVNWDRVRAKFYEMEDFRKSAADEGSGGLVEWSSMREGEFLESAINTVDTLEDLFRDWLLQE